MRQSCLANQRIGNKMKDYKPKEAKPLNLKLTYEWLVAIIMVAAVVALFVYKF